MEQIRTDTRPSNRSPIHVGGLNGLREPANGNARSAPAVATASIFPRDAIARIYRPARSPTTSGKARTKRWVLRFERRTPSVIDPLMGWTGGDDPLTQVELTFPTRETAIAYAERQGLTYVVEESHPLGVPQPQRERENTRDDQAQAFDELARAIWLWFAWLQLRYGPRNSPKPPDLERALVSPAAVFRAPRDVVDCPDLTCASKREILMRWAWDEQLLQLASDEAMPDGHELSRLDEVKCALLALEEAERDGLLVLSIPTGSEERRAA